jgi:hypothetical protein
MENSIATGVAGKLFGGCGVSLLTDKRGGKACGSHPAKKVSS